MSVGKLHLSGVLSTALLNLRPPASIRNAGVELSLDG